LSFCVRRHTARKMERPSDHHLAFGESVLSNSTPSRILCSRQVAQTYSIRSLVGKYAMWNAHVTSGAEIVSRCRLTVRFVPAELREVGLKVVPYQPPTE
jgi:hypothetical protein